MTIAEIEEKMILISNGNTHDINHFLKVYAYAKLIGTKERLDEKTMKTLETAALLHDIACPLCREKYGNTNGKFQEEEGTALVRKFFAKTDLDPEIVERVVYLVGHHHTFQNICGIDYQILVEADYLVNADESNYSKENIQHTKDYIFKTETAKKLIDSIYSF